LKFISFPSQKLFNPFLKIKGGYSFVYLVEEEMSGEKFALKKLLLGDSQSIKACKNEIDIMLKLKNHKNIVKLIDHSIFTNNRGETEANLLMEFCSSKKNFNFH
jgi:AP2-associated kinase